MIVRLYVRTTDRRIVFITTEFHTFISNLPGIEAFDADSRITAGIIRSNCTNYVVSELPVADGRVAAVESVAIPEADAPELSLLAAQCEMLRRIHRSVAMARWSGSKRLALQSRVYSMKLAEANAFLARGVEGPMLAAACLASTNPPAVEAQLIVDKAAALDALLVQTEIFRITKNAAVLSATTAEAAFAVELV